MTYFSWFVLAGILIAVFALIRSKYPSSTIYGENIQIDNTKRLNVEVMQGTMSKAKVTASFYVPATMFASERFLVLTFRRRSIWNINISALPIVIWNPNFDKVEIPLKAETVIPEKLELTDWKKLNLEFHREGLMSVSHQLTVNLQTEDDLSVLRNLKISHWNT